MTEVELNGIMGDKVWGVLWLLIEITQKCTRRECYDNEEDGR